MEMTETMFERMVRENPVEQKKKTARKEKVELNSFALFTLGLIVVTTILAFLGVGFVSGAEGFLAVAVLNMVAMWSVSFVFGAISLLGWPVVAVATLVAFVMFPGIWIIGALGLAATVFRLIIELNQ